MPVPDRGSLRVNNMPDILLFPLPELGHVLPTLSLTRYLTSIGHRVVYLTAPQFAKYITSVGGEIEPLFSQDTSQVPLSGGAIWYRHLTNYGTDKDMVRLRRLITTFLGRSAFSFVLCDYIFGNKVRRCLVESIGRDRLAFISTSLFNWKRYRHNKWGIRTLVLCPDEFEIEMFRICHPGVFHVEPSLPPTNWETPVKELSTASSHLVVVAFGAQAIRYRHLNGLLMTINELARLRPEFNFVLSMGRCGTSEYNRSFPLLSNLTVQQEIPQRLLLQRASAMITHGGLGSLKEAICAGVPLIVLPMLYDQPFNAMRVRHYGLGTALFSEDQSLNRLEAAVCDAVGGRFSTHVSAMQSIFVDKEREHRSHFLVSNWIEGKYRTSPCETDRVPIFRTQIIDSRDRSGGKVKSGQAPPS